MRYKAHLIVASPAVIFEVCERQTGISRDMLRAPGRQARLAAMRAVVGRALFEMAGFSVAEVGKELCRDHSTINYQLRHTMESRPVLEQQYDLLKSEVEQVTKAARSVRNIALPAPEDVADSGEATS